MTVAMTVVETLHTIFGWAIVVSLVWLLGAIVYVFRSKS